MLEFKFSFLQHSVYALINYKLRIRWKNFC
nr:MAG TPA: hypothetical protein [Caudoviricetes sp.]